MLAAAANTTAVDVAVLVNLRHVSKLASMLMSADPFFDQRVAALMAAVSRAAERVVTVGPRGWIFPNHHLSHAAMGFYGSGMSRALVISSDGLGNDGYFNVYEAGRVAGGGGWIRPLAELDLEIGGMYNSIAVMLPEVVQRTEDPHYACVMDDKVLANFTGCLSPAEIEAAYPADHTWPHHCRDKCWLALAGKLMGVSQGSMPAERPPLLFTTFEPCHPP